MPITLDAKQELISYIDEALHRSIMTAEPDRRSADHRQRLVDLQATRLDVMSRLRHCETAKDVILSFLRRAKAGELDEVNHNATTLGLPTMLDLLAGIQTRAQELGLLYEQQMAEKFHTAAQHIRPAELHEPAQHSPGDLKEGDDLQARQDLLLDEGLEETFPASDALSIKLIC